MLRTDVKRWSLVGIVAGLLIILVTPLFPIGLFLVSLFKERWNCWLTTRYQATDPIPEDKRLWGKYTLQNIGSILTQFLLMVLASVIILRDGHTIQDFFVMTTASSPTPESIQVMHGWNTDNVSAGSDCGLCANICLSKESQSFKKRTFLSVRFYAELKQDMRGLGLFAL